MARQFFYQVLFVVLWSSHAGPMWWPLPTSGRWQWEARSGWLPGRTLCVPCQNWWLHPRLLVISPMMWLCLKMVSTPKPSLVLLIIIPSLKMAISLGIYPRFSDKPMWLPWWYWKLVAIHGNLTGNHERTHASSKHQEKRGLWCLVILLIGTKCRPWGYGMVWPDEQQTALDQHWINKWHLGRKGLDLDYSPWIVVGLLSKWGRLYPYLSGPNFATHPCFPFVRDPSRCDAVIWSHRNSLNMFLPHVGPITFLWATRPRMDRS